MDAESGVRSRAVAHGRAPTDRQDGALPRVLRGAAGVAVTAPTTAKKGGAFAIRLSGQHSLPTYVACERHTTGRKKAKGFYLTSRHYADRFASAAEATAFAKLNRIPIVAEQDAYHNEYYIVPWTRKAIPMSPTPPSGT